MTSLLVIAVFAIVMGYVFCWLMRYSARNELGNGGETQLGWRISGGARDSTVSAYARRAAEMARNADRELAELQARRPTVKATEPVPEQETETRAGA